MSMKECVVLAYVMKCDHCPCETLVFCTTSDMLKNLRISGWQSVVTYEQGIAQETWKCPTCIAVEVQVESYDASALIERQPSRGVSEFVLSDEF